MIDGISRQILSILQDEARTSNAEIGRRVGLTPSAVFERVRKLEEREVVEGYTARLSARAVGLGLLAFIFVRSDERLGAQETGDALAALPEVQEVHDVAGEDCFLVKVRVADTEHLERLLREHIGAIPTVRSTRTTIVLKTVKESSRLAIAGAAAGAASEQGDADE